MSYKDMMETFFDFPEREGLKVYIHPETIKVIESRLGPNATNWAEGIGKHLEADSNVLRGKCRYVYTKEIDTGLDNGA